MKRRLFLKLPIFASLAIYGSKIGLGSESNSFITGIKLIDDCLESGSKLISFFSNEVYEETKHIEKDIADLAQYTNIVFPLSEYKNGENKIINKIVKNKKDVVVYKLYDSFDAHAYVDFLKILSMKENKTIIIYSNYTNNSLSANNRLKFNSDVIINYDSSNGKRVRISVVKNRMGKFGSIVLTKDSLKDI